MQIRLNHDAARPVSVARQTQSAHTVGSKSSALTSPAQDLFFGGSSKKQAQHPEQEKLDKLDRRVWPKSYSEVLPGNAPEEGYRNHNHNVGGQAAIVASQPEVVDEDTRRRVHNWLQHLPHHKEYEHHNQNSSALNSAHPQVAVTGHAWIRRPETPLNSWSGKPFQLMDGTIGMLYRHGDGIRRPHDVVTGAPLG